MHSLRKGNKNVHIYRRKIFEKRTISKTQFQFRVSDFSSNSYQNCMLYEENS